MHKLKLSFFMIIIIHGIFSFSLAQAENRFHVVWTKLSANSEQNKKILLETLGRSPLGKRIIELSEKKAKSLHKKLEDVLLPGSVSLTDTTLIRQFTRDNPFELSYQTKAVVYISSELSLGDAVIDLAHELTHFIGRPFFNPYDDDFSYPSFLISTIEGKGGEVDAFLSECKVMKELFTAQWAQSKCQEVWDGEKHQRDLVVKKFYQIGILYEEFYKDVKEELQNQNLDFLTSISDQMPLFVSSAYSLPYPVAAFREFQMIIRKVCVNDQNRLRYMKEKFPQGHAQVDLAEKSFFKKCEAIKF